MIMKKQRVLKILIRFQLIGFIFFCLLTDAFAVTITNGDFSTDPEVGWARHVPGDGFIDYGPSAQLTFRNMLRIIGNDDGCDSCTVFVAQNIGAVAGTVGGASGMDIVFDLLRYYSNDSSNLDYPVFIIDGTQYRLYNHGNGKGGTDNHGTLINNSNDVTSTTKMRVRIPDSDGADVTIGFGVFSDDGLFGSGELRVDNVTYNYLPTILEQTKPLEIVERQPLQLTIDDITATDVESSFPDDFTLTVQDGDHYSVSGNTIVSDTGLLGDLDVAVTVSDGVSDSPVFDMTVHVIARPANKDFSLNPPSGWDNTSHSITAGDISYGEAASPAGVLQITGDDTGQVDSRVMTTQNLYSFDGEATLSFDLLHYSSADHEDYDYPFFCYKEGDNEMVFYRLYNLGGGSGGFSGGTGQRIDNDNEVSFPLTFRFPLHPTDGEPVTVGFGVFSADGRFGAGTLQIDNLALDHTVLTFNDFPGDQTIAENTQTGALAFSFSGLSSPVISGSSSSPSLIPEDDEHIVINCPAQSTDCTINVIPEINQSGSSRITVTVNDGTLSIKDNFIVTVTPDTSAPQLTATFPAANEAQAAGDTSLSMKFSKNIQAVAEGDNRIRIYDDATDELIESYPATGSEVTISNDTLLLDRTSAPPLAFSHTYYIIVGTEAIRDLTSSQNSFAGIADKDTWAFTIRDNEAPTISAIDDQATEENTSVTVGFTVSDEETDAGSLTVTATSDNQTLLPDANIVPGGSGGNRTLVLTPATDQFGTATVTVTVADTGESTSVAFTLSVTLLDTDGDGTADCIDSDDDNDGLSDEQENSYGTDPLDADTDGDGMSDGNEVAQETDPLTAEGPGIPILIAPEAAATGIVLSAPLEVGYMAGASLPTHQATRWQIGLDETFASLVMDVTTHRRLLTLTVTDLVLDSDTLYYWRVCFTGDDGLVRSWSTTNSFTTAIDDRGDADGDRIPDDQEPTAVGIVPDAEAGWRDTLYWLTGQAGNGDTFQVGLRLADDGSSLLFFEHLPDIPDDCPSSLDLGLFTMKIQVPTPGGSTFVRFYLSPSPLDDEAGIFKYDNAMGWYDYTGYASLSGDFSFFTVELVDGGLGDADGVVNGMIVDPLGTGKALVEDVSSASSGDWGGCFIRTIFQKGF